MGNSRPHLGGVQSEKAGLKVAGCWAEVHWSNETLSRPGSIGPHWSLEAVLLHCSR